jgi:RecJ-like exonuclease
MTDKQRTNLEEMLLRLNKRTKEDGQHLAALDVEINQSVKFAHFFLNSAKGKGLNPDLRLAQRTAARHLEGNAAVAKKVKSRVQQQMQKRLDLCEQVAGILAAMKT